MAIPAGIATVVVSGRYIRPDGTPLTGTVSFEPPAHLTFPSVDTIGVGGATVALDADGSFVTTLVATDAPGMQPTGWTYRVTERLARIPERVYNISVPLSASAVDLADVVPREGDESGYVLSRVARGDIGYHIPAGWGANWRAKRDAAAAGGAAARILVAGDSLSQGWYASDLTNTSWVGVMRSRLQASFGDGGSGFYSTSRSDPAISASEAVMASWIANGSAVSTTGTWGLGPQYYGPGVTYLSATDATASATFKVRGSTAKVFTLVGAAPRAPYTVTIDGGAPVTVPPLVGGGNQIQTTTFEDLTPSDHTVTVTWAGVSGDILYLVGASGENPSGVVVDNMGRAGSASANWSTGNALNAAWNGGAAYPADLVVCSLGLNDSNTSVTADAWLTNVGAYLQTVRDAQDGATDILLVLQHLGTYGGPALYRDYAVRMRGLAEAYGAALINVWALGRNSYSHWGSLGYWGDANVAGPAGTDRVHASDAGHAFIAGQVAPVLMS